MINNVKVVELFSSEEIERRVGELAKQITTDYAQMEPHLICVLKGASIFMADLARRIELPITSGFISASSYGDKKSSSGEVNIVSDISAPVDGKDVLIVEDIVDTGRTLEILKEMMMQRGARTVKTVVILDKPSRRKTPVEADYIGFTVEERFVVGYGLDYNEKYRDLPFIGYVD